MLVPRCPPEQVSLSLSLSLARARSLSRPPHPPPHTPSFPSLFAALLRSWLGCLSTVRRAWSVQYISSCASAAARVRTVSLLLPPFPLPHFRRYDWLLLPSPFNRTTGSPPSGCRVSSCRWFHPPRFRFSQRQLHRQACTTLGNLIVLAFSLSLCVCARARVVCRLLSGAGKLEWRQPHGSVCCVCWSEAWGA